MHGTKLQRTTILSAIFSALLNYHLLKVGGLAQL